MTAQYRVCIGKLISLTFLLLSFYAPYQLHPNNLQISFGFIYSHCCYFEPSQLLPDIQLWMHSWGFSFQLNASRNKISEKWVHPSWLRFESFSKEIFTGKILLAPSSRLQFKFGFHFSHLQQCENPNELTVFSKKVPISGMCLFSLSKGISRYSVNLLFLPWPTASSKAFIYILV